MAAGVDPEGRPSWNVPPSRGVPVVVDEKPDEHPETDQRTEDGESRDTQRAVKGTTRREERELPSSEELKRRLDIYRWGLLPHWAKDTRVGYKMINAKAETLTKSSAYRVPFRQRRCLIVVDGFYEWRADPSEPKKKVPFYFRRADGSPITFAGLHESWWDKTRSKEPDPETLIRTCTIITTDAGPDMVEVHNRMPVIIEHSDIDAWLDPDQHDPEVLQKYLGPSPGGTLLKHPISKRVNSPRNDGPDLIEPVEEPEA
jgi:putative SOS response-associated peptidase YedK